MKRYILFILYPTVLLAFSFWSYLYVDWHLELLSFSWYKNLQDSLWYFGLNQRILSASFYILIILLLYSLYILFLVILGTSPSTSFGINSARTPESKRKGFWTSQNDVILLLVITIIILFFSHPALSHDIFNYLMSAKIITYYHENPWMVMPIEFIGEPMLNFLHAANKIVLYGPSWVFLTLIPSYLGQNNFLLTFGLLKILVIGFYLGSLWLIYQTNKEQKNTPAIQNLIFFAFNPLVLIETLSSSHNDVVMMFFVLLSFYLLRKHQFLFSVVCFLFSVGIKYAAIILLPVYLYAIYQLGKKEEVNFNRIFLWSAVLMYVVFFLSPLREELYPWYLIWPLSFLAIVQGNGKLKIFTIALSFGLLLRYVPFMLTFSWFGETPLIKKAVTVIPMLLFFVWYAYTFFHKRFS